MELRHLLLAGLGLISLLLEASADPLPTIPATGISDEPRYRIDFHTAENPFSPEDTDLEMIPMTDKDGGKFECYLPKKIEPTTKDNDSSITLAVDVEDDSKKSPEELLDILKGTCLHRHEGWWTYEFCYPPPGSLRQFHIDNKKETQGFVLGNYDKEATARLHEASPVLVQKDPRSQTAEQKYYAFMYTNGTKCDLTGQPRETEVRFVCSDNGVGIGSVKEAPTCKYTMIFEAPMLCRHPMFREKQRPWLVVNCNAKAGAIREEAALELESRVDDQLPSSDANDQASTLVSVVQ